MKQDDPRLAAYHATIYRCHAPSGDIDLRIGAKHPELDKLLDDAGVTCWCFITAWNPQSQPLPEAENEQRQQQLQQAIASEGWTTLPGAGVGIGDDGRWSEPSLLVLGIERAEAIELGQRFDQAAILCGVRGGAAELVWCRAE